MHWVRTNISSIYYFTKIPIILKQHIQSDWITNELRKPWGDVLGTLSAHGYSKLWRTSFSMNKPTTWCKSGRVSLVSSSCLYKTQPETDGQTENTICRAAWSLLKTKRHLFYVTSNSVHHFTAISQFKLELQSGNTQFGSKSTSFCPMWPWDLTDDLEKQ